MTKKVLHEGIQSKLRWPPQDPQHLSPCARELVSGDQEDTVLVLPADEVEQLVAARLHQG